MRRSIVLATFFAASIAAASFACSTFDEGTAAPGADGGASSSEGGGGADGAAGGGGDAGPAKLVFLAQSLLTSQLVQQADSVCDTTIKRLSPSRRAIAWVYAAKLTPLQRLGLAEGPWATPTGRPVFATRAALTSAAPSNPITETVDGLPIMGQKAWTGLNPDGGPSGLDCQQWAATGTTDEATVAVTAATTPEWASSDKVLCDQMHTVICFEY